MVEGYNICNPRRKQYFLGSGEWLTYHTNAGTKSVWWEVAPEFSLHNTRVTMRAGDTTKVSVCKCMGGEG